MTWRFGGGFGSVARRPGGRRATEGYRDRIESTGDARFTTIRAESHRFAFPNFHSAILNRIKNIEAMITARRSAQKRQPASIPGNRRFTARHHFGIHKHSICLAKSPKNQGFFQIADPAFPSAHSG